MVMVTVRYTSYYGDGDSKAYEAIKFTYNTEKPIQKFECIRHYQEDFLLLKLNKKLRE